MEEYLSPEQLENISSTSIPFPLYFVKDGEGMDQVLQAMAIVDVGTITLMGVPQSLELEKYSPSGIITTARYELVDTYKAHESKYQPLPEDN